MSAYDLMFFTITTGIALIERREKEYRTSVVEDVKGELTTF